MPEKLPTYLIPYAVLAEVVGVLTPEQRAEAAARVRAIEVQPDDHLLRKILNRHAEQVEAGKW